jgi:amino acid transporter
LFVYTCFAIAPITTGLWLFSFASIIGGNLLLALLITAGAAVCGATVYAFLSSRLPRLGGEYVWQSLLLSYPVGFVIAVTAWWFAVVNLAPVFGNLLIAEVGDPLLAELNADGARSWLHGSAGAFAASLIGIVIATVAAAVRPSTYARIQRALFAIGVVAVGACAALLLAHSQLDFQQAFNRETSDLYGANENPSVTTLLSTPVRVQIRDVHFASTILLAPLLALSLTLVGWGNPLSAEVRGITRRSRTVLAVAGAVIFSTAAALLILLAIRRSVGWTFWNAENDVYWGAVYGNRTTPPLGSWPSPLMQAGWLVNNSAFQVGLLLATAAWVIGWMGTLFLSSTRVLLAAVTREEHARHPPQERVLLLLVLPAMAISALSAYWDAFARQSAAAVAIPFAVAGIASSLAALTVAREAGRSLFAAAAVYIAFLVFVVVRWIQAPAYAMGPGALAYAGGLYLLTALIYASNRAPQRTKPGRRG